MVQDAGMCAPAATIAVGWMLTAVLTRGSRAPRVRASFGARGVRAHMMVASQASLPSTVTVPCILTASVRQLRTLTSMRS